MKVIPKIKYRQLHPDEIRVINIDKQAVTELLWETLMEHAADYFHVKETSDEYMCSMDWDTQEGCLTYVAFPMDYAQEGTKLDFDRIRQKVGITTPTLFQENKYTSLRITPDIVAYSRSSSMPMYQQHHEV